MKKLAERFFKYDNFDRDIFFHPLIKGKKGRLDFYDTCKCMVWEESRTRYEVDEEFRQELDLNMGIRRMFDSLMVDASSPEETRGVASIGERFQNEFMSNAMTKEQLSRHYFFWSNFPCNVQTWPEKAYLSHQPKIRKTWCYEPFSEKKKYENISFESIGDKEPSPYKEGFGKEVTMKVPITINLDPFWDEMNLRRVLNENIGQIQQMVHAQKEILEKEGYVFRSEKPKEQRPRSWYEKGLRFLGHYRLYKCEGWRFYKIEELFKKACDDGKASSMEKDHFMKKVKKELPQLPL